MKAISQPGLFLREARTRAALSQRQLAVRAGTAQSVVARIERGQSNPALDTLARLLAAAGFEIDMRLAPKPARDSLVEAYKRDIDRSLLRHNLEKTPDQRVRSLQALSDLAVEARRAGRSSRRRR